MGNLHQGVKRGCELPQSTSVEQSQLGCVRDPSMRHVGFRGALFAAERRHFRRETSCKDYVKETLHRFIDQDILGDISCGFDSEAIRSAINADQKRFGLLLYNQPLLVEMFIKGMPDVLTPHSKFEAQSDERSASHNRTMGEIKVGPEIDYLTRLHISVRLKDGQRGGTAYLPPPMVSLTDTVAAINRDPAGFSKFLLENKLLGAMVAEWMGIATPQSENT